MIYTLIVGTKSYDLPKKTLAIVEKLDGVVVLDKNPRMNTRDKYQSILNLEEELLGKSNLEEILGATSLDDVDLSVVVITFRKIVDAYNKPVQEYDRAASTEAFNRIPVEKLSQLAALVKAIPDKG